ncbi:hypothetical protein HB364_10825 [Pseudoflavitalea sp. X16]|uniref:hypothetical protein n=1 Tax=Paraflavitalea devenefica TaxID=2716334 RepID=UPI00141DC2FB|nr:hypothetical protein [Paraflavitalea devenefica]NII25578.1 hypothetical protein [Paraflavitalea devenefica]
MTHDEAYSYYLVKTNYFIAMFGTANNHWLNTFFMEIFNMVFGDTPGVMRLQCILAFPFFAFAIYRLSSLIKGLSGQLIFYALVLFNPYILDFFSLARGYSLAMTFQAWSIVYFVKAAQTSFQYRPWLMVIILNALALASNISFFYTVAGMAGLFVCQLAISKYVNRTPIHKTTSRLFLLYVLLMIVTIADLLFLKYYGKTLYFGGETDLMESLVETTWEGSLYRASYSYLSPVLTYVSCFLLVIVCTWYTFRCWYSKKISTGFILCLPFVSIVVLNVLFHLLLKNPYLSERTALQWYVPGILLICFAGGEYLSFPKTFRFLGTATGMVVFFAGAAHLYRNANRHLCYEWPLQTNSQQPVLDLYAQKPQHPYMGYSTAGVYVNYYALLYDLQPKAEYLPEIDVHNTGTQLRDALLKSDYVISYYPSTLSCLQQLGLRYEVLKTYPPGNNKLIKIYH